MTSIGGCSSPFAFRAFSMPKTRQKTSSDYVTLSVRVKPRYFAWVGALEAHTRLRVSEMFDLALVDYAKKVGFKEPAPSRFE